MGDQDQVFNEGNLSEGREGPEQIDLRKKINELFGEEVLRAFEREYAYFFRLQVKLLLINTTVFIGRHFLSFNFNRRRSYE